jgi:ABC-type antimicrobial peptide transport system permease subunit
MVVTIDGLTRLLNDPTDTLDLDGAFVRLDDDDPATRERLLDIGWQPVTPPSKVANLAQIGSVPRLLAIALGALGFAGAIHALLVAVARRRGDLAVVRALGFTPRQARFTVAWQGIVTACAAIVVGIPLGVLIGRVVWKRVTSGVGAVDLVSIPWLACIAVPVTALGVVTLAAWIVGRRAATFRTAAVLRSE